MKIIYGLNNLKCQKKKSVVTIGIFDGIHIGHQKILKETVARAKAKRHTATVLTFHPHPKKVLGRTSSKSTITSLEHRLKLLENMGINLCIVIKFTTSFSKKPAGWFIKHILVKKLRTETLIVGSRFKLGREKILVKKLGKLLEDQEIDFKIIPTQRYNGKIISSSLIRRLIERGKLDIVSKLLARPVAIYGTVISGKRRGRILGFRTANIDPHHEVIPPSGVYAVKARVDKEYYNGVLNIGFRPTFHRKQKEPTIEVHVIGFNARLYNKDLELFFIKKIRSEKHFKSKEALKQQIKRDIEKI